MHMHRHILKAGPGQEIDHRDGDGLNNQRFNLRYCTDSENHANQHHKMAGCSSHYKGVGWYKATGKWRAVITVDYIFVHLGYFDSESDAAHAYNTAALKFFGEFARLNAL